MEDNRYIFLEKNANVGFVLGVRNQVSTIVLGPSFIQAQFKQNIVVDLMY